MLDSGSSFQSQSALLKTVLQPLLEDFQYWFDKGRSLLETHRLDFLSAEQQADLLDRIKQAEQELAASQALFSATEGQIGVDAAVMVRWHRLVTECWQAGRQFRMKH